MRASIILFLFLSDRAIIIADDYVIPGGNKQECYEGYDPHPFPVQNDVDRWLSENKEEAELMYITPWSWKQAVILYERKR